ncbi:16S rRNA (cytosine(967)-C(5))-methyltransferase RsmB [Moraxella nasibovis]|uniref:16S rRNA (cytosine(967)-C(5))-methyltransferase RsmB n=1 Tax=Moraxella nasibovis TaxID=2904120 RepID=UPI00240F3773|nr:16S rRNA (cytosine(967)-C(5))-methyltransferase RsmB [Moraxella nasibovis]WFF38663.1 16S rRNA (cytosine(967)-C(5))-methyltransferase RsmB [Moraxella nasibovis]
MGQIVKSEQKLSVRANVILTLEKIHQGQSLSLLLDGFLGNVSDNERGFAHELLLGTLRQWHAINRIGESLIKTPPTDVGMICALNMGLYELLYMTTPEYATINETLNALKAVDKNYGVGLVNAILRKVASSREKYRKKVDKNHSLPNWLAKQIKQDWGVEHQEYYELLGQNLRQSAPVFLRVNAKFTSVHEYAKLLTQANIAHQIVPLGMADASAIRLKGSVKIQNLPHFADGWVSVQDRHAQLCGHILAGLNLPSFSLLDACTAPGGKLAQMLELSKAGVFHMKHTVALDNDERRLQRVHENLARLQLTDQADIICTDGRAYQADTPFDVIVLDAPCTATGVVRRHPDIALLRDESDVEQTVRLQSEILVNLWQQLAVGGYLLYVTCSLLKAENESQLLDFLAKNTNAKVVDFTLNLPNQIKQAVGYQCLPLHADDGDGFYYGLLQKL